jgi:integrase
MNLERANAAVLRCETCHRVSDERANLWAALHGGGRLHVRHTLAKDGTLGAPKTDAGRRIVPLGGELVKLLAEVIPADADSEHFVFSQKYDRTKPLRYNNVRSRGWVPARDAAGLPQHLTIHDLRKAAISLYHAQGMSLVEIAGLVGHADATITAKVYARPVNTPELDARARAAQAVITGRA